VPSAAAVAVNVAFEELWRVMVPPSGRGAPGGGPPTASRVPVTVPVVGWEPAAQPATSRPAAMMATGGRRGHLTSNRTHLGRVGFQRSETDVATGGASWRRGQRLVTGSPSSQEPDTTPRRCTGGRGCGRRGASAKDGLETWAPRWTMTGAWTTALEDLKPRPAEQRVRGASDGSNTAAGRCGWQSPSSWSLEGPLRRSSPLAAQRPEAARRAAGSSRAAPRLRSA